MHVQKKINCVLNELSFKTNSKINNPLILKIYL